MSWLPPPFTGGTIFRSNESATISWSTIRSSDILIPTAAKIFHLSDGMHDLDSLERELRNTFEVSRERDLRSDILAAIESLREKGLLR